MSQILDDGSVIPSFLRVSNSQEEVSGWRYALNDVSLRVGRVVAQYAPDDPNNRNKKYIEYDVEVQHADGAGGFATIIYPRAQIASLFGGIADRMQWTPRIVNFDVSKQIGDSSRVLLLCLNGNSRAVFIIGGLPHPDVKTKQDPALKHNLDWEFNGLNALINNDGELILVHKGATDSSGNIIDDTGAYSSIKFSKEGNIILGYTIDDNKKPSFILDKQNDKILAYTKSNTELTTEDGFLINTKNGFVVNPGGILPQAFLKATTYRQQQQLLHTTLQSLLTTATGFASAAGVALTGAAGAIVVSGAAAAPFLATAGASLTALAPILTSMQVAIQSFEALADDYLSKKHFHSESN